LEYCTDNAAMIAAAGRQLLINGQQQSLELDITPMEGAISIGKERRVQESSYSYKRR
jgi:tRNA A37 threonylcarbamoyltransferase TsaD